MSKLRQYLPPVLVQFLTGLLYGWSKDYKSWKDGQNKWSNYDNNISDRTPIFGKEKIQDQFSWVKIAIEPIKNFVV